MNSINDTEETENRKKDKNRIRNLGIVGAAFAAFSAISAFDAVADFSGVVKLMVAHWHYAVTVAWNFVLGAFGFEPIQRLDAVFLTFFLMMVISLLMSLQLSDPNLSKQRYFQGWIFTVIGLAIIAGIFALGDQAVYEATFKETGSPEFYKSSIQSYFYSTYVGIIDPGTWMPASENPKLIQLAFLFVFYIVSLTIIFIVFLLAPRLVGLRVNIWSVATRLWLIITIFALVVGFYYGTIFFEYLVGK